MVMRIPNWVLASGLATVVALGAGSSFAGKGIIDGLTGGGGGGRKTTPVAPTPKPVAPAPTPVVAPANCAVISTATTSAGYSGVNATIALSFSIADTCATPSTWKVSVIDIDGATQYTESNTTDAMSVGSVTASALEFGAKYNVSLTVTSSTGTQLAKSTLSVSTKKARDFLAAALQGLNNANNVYRSAAATAADAGTAASNAAAEAVYAHDVVAWAAATADSAATAAADAAASAVAAADAATAAADAAAVAPDDADLAAASVAAAADAASAADASATAAANAQQANDYATSTAAAAVAADSAAAAAASAAAAADAAAATAQAALIAAQATYDGLAAIA